MIRDQPPELEHEPGPGDLPPVLPAAERILDFIGAFGDGLVDRVVVKDELGRALCTVPLYARDLVAVAEHVRTAAGS